MAVIVIADEATVDSAGAAARKAYKKVIIREHPDKGGTQERFQAIQTQRQYLYCVPTLIAHLTA